MLRHFTVLFTIIAITACGVKSKDQNDGPTPDATDPVDKMDPEDDQGGGDPGKDPGNGGEDAARGDQDNNNNDDGGDDQQIEGDVGVFSLSPKSDQRKLSQFCDSTAPDDVDDPTPAMQFDIELLREKLSGDGLRGWMHGVVPRYQHYLFTYRSEDPNDPMAFFKAEQFSLVPQTDALRTLIEGLNRHDEVRLKGQVMGGRSPFRHLLITDVEIIETFDSPTNNSYRFDMSKLKDVDRFELFGKVHAVVKSERLGYGFVVEYEDSMLPLMVSEPDKEAAARLFRNDIVNVAVRVIHHPNRPPHLMTDPDKGGIQFVDRIVNCHGDQNVLKGFLVKFKKSPAISTDVYAVRIVDPNGIGRNFTFFPDVPMSEPDRFVELFRGLRDKAAQTWDADEADPAVVRNYWSKTHIQVEVHGKMNVVSTEQANPQIYVKDLNHLQFSTTQN